MHLNVEKKYIGYLLTTAEHRGRNWENVAARQESERAQREIAAHPEGDHGGGH
jgi:hypothetical protein